MNFGFGAISERQSMNRLLRHTETLGKTMIAIDTSMHITPREWETFSEKMKCLEKANYFEINFLNDYRSRRFAAANRRRKAKWSR